ncbi:HPr(Ser) kinase/phosphatase [Bhargavaea beijingensis]|uniref:HPr kinase/phosphorylase n=1 Tax=Bhargavaea beijingensis TaxID=426756 RepID=A0A1G7GK07_9BACL|nr:HPr(Ser) kinase/phosphatase [Bhargavaea beijingensis]MCW1927553.1 HPr(Ser) kinase/phosphatase [Bhargavaea beijingensis]RSK34895.1 HPr kinase/phosphorylase [Bhargavaea beijingensis]SDE88498.1 Hpr(Ser) kinase/phosphatase [Bhargavaea beijingensis]
MDHVTVKDVMERFGLELSAGAEGIGRHIASSDISRPGLEVAGFFEYYPANRIQLLGKSEISFFSMLPRLDKMERARKLCSPDTPMIVVCHSMRIPPELVAAAEEEQVPLLSSPMTTTKLSNKLSDFLENRLAPMTAVHGVLLDIYGLGVLITGKSGIGKSEVALDLVKRGHRLVADDMVEIRQVAEDTLVGNPPELLRHLLEIRGLGIIDVQMLFGASAIRDFKRITLIIDLESWDPERTYDRLGLEEEKLKILDTELTRLTVPVRPGRNMSSIVEVAAMNHRMKQMGMNAAEQFSDRLNDMIGREQDPSY